MSDEKKWVPLVRCEDVPLRQGRSVRFGDRDVAIFNLGDRFLAIENGCPHMGTPLSEGLVLGTTVVCPLHAWKINLDSGYITSPAHVVACTETFRTRLEDGVVLVELPA
jgi:nitrite reductase (NADH) small subunit